jgi:hypothetical protein
MFPLWSVGSRPTLWLLPLVLLTWEGRASAQIFEAVGSRALGMGGAFVAVANDSSATWWNPGGLAAGPFLDLALARAVTDSSRQTPARRDRATWFAVAAPAFGLSYYRLRVTEAGLPPATDPDGGVREEGQGPVPVRSLAVSQFGATVVQSVASGVHLGTTVKYVRGRLRGGLDGTGLAAPDALDAGEDLDGGDVQHKLDVDIGLLAVGGPLRLGAVMRNVRRPAFTSDDGSERVRLPRQVRLGAAFDGEAIDFAPVTFSLDADLRRYDTAAGERRVVALGGEGWLLGKRIGLRAGGRWNTVGAEDRAATGGISVALRSGLYLDGHIVRGGTADDRGWGLAARVSF